MVTNSGTIEGSGETKGGGSSEDTGTIILKGDYLKTNGTRYSNAIEVTGTAGESVEAMIKAISHPEASNGSDEKDNPQSHIDFRGLFKSAIANLYLSKADFFCVFRDFAV